MLCYVMEGEYSYSSFVSRHVSFWFLSHWFWLLVPPSGWTVWVYSGQIHCSLLSLLFISPQRGLRAGLIHHKGSQHAFLNVQGSSLAVIYNSSISQAGDTGVCVSDGSKLLLSLVIDVLLIVE